MFFLFSLKSTRSATLFFDKYIFSLFSNNTIVNKSLLGDYMKIEKNEDYKELTEKHLKKSPVIKNSCFAFLAGGFLCFLGELL